MEQRKCPLSATEPTVPKCYLGTTWKRGALWDVNRVAATSSDIAAVAYHCPACYNEAVVVYQASGGAL